MTKFTAVFVKQPLLFSQGSAKYPRGKTPVQIDPLDLLDLSECLTV